jgi:Restriction endonuclease NotI
LVSIASERATLRTTCPYRFEQDGTIYRWIGERILGDPNAVPTGQMPFLEPVETMGSVDPGTKGTKREVGRIDNILVIPGSEPLKWCPVELQAVYFSGKKMALDFEHMISAEGSGLPWPTENRRPDYRSSGPKRLLPQLSTKIPTLGGWAKRMAVVVDEDFFNQLGRMNPANDLSNSDLVWFVVRYEEEGSGFVLKPAREPFMTKLKEAEFALVAGTALPQPKFEESIRKKLKKMLNR